MNSIDFITSLENSLDIDEKIAVSILSVPYFLNDAIAIELLDLEILSDSKENLFSRIQSYPIWKRKTKDSWIIEDDIRFFFLKKLNGNSERIIRIVHEKLEDFKPLLIEVLNKKELKDFVIQLSRLSLSLPQKQEKGIQLFRYLYDVSEIYEIYSTSELIYKYLEEGLEINEQSEELPSYILNALFMKGMHSYKKRNYDKALKYLMPVWKNHDNSFLRLKDAGIASHIIGLIWKKNKSSFKTIINAFDSSIKLRIEVNDQIGLAQTYHSLGNLYSSHKMLKQAILAYEESLRLDKLNNNQQGVAEIYHSLGNLFSQFSSHFDDAEKSFKKSIKMQENVPDKYSLAQTYHSFANLLAKKPDRVSDASEFYEASIKLGLKVDIKRHLAQVYMKYAMLKIKTGQFSDAKNLLNKALNFEKKPFYKTKILKLIDEIKNNF